MKYVIFLIIIFVILGLVMTIRPDFFWYVTESWKSNDASEPSNLYILSTRIGEILFVLVGIACSIALYIS